MIAATLGELCTIQKGTFPTLSTPPGDYPMVVTAAFRRSASSFDVEGPAVCIPTISSTGHGDAALHRVHYQEGKFALANLLVALIPRDPSVCDAKFLYYFLNAKRDQLIVPLMQGTANVSLKSRDLEGVVVPLPAIEEQRRTVARVEAIAAKVEEAQCIRAGQLEKLSGLLRSEFHRIVTNAPRVSLGRIAPLVRRPVQVQIEAAYPEVGVRSFGRGTFHKPVLLGAEVGTKKLFEIRTGDLLFNIVFAWEGAIAVAKPEDDGRVGSHRFLTCVPDPKLATARFLRYYFLTPEGLAQVGVASPGGAGRNRTLGLKAAATMTVPSPPVELQLQFDRLQDMAAEFNEQAELANAELNALVPSVLDRAFKGDL